jgi:chromosome segregation protein
VNQVVARELVLENFKSFGVKTRIPLKSGFTTISGPNGSGKSNLLDALLFVLGLSSSKQLRAERLPDLITNQKGKTFARVGLKLSVPDPENRSERIMEVARAVRITGAGYVSTYYLDGKATPLTRVHETLNELGIGSQGGNVVLQGDVTRIITMSPLERRRLIDELAGVAEFDRRIEQAEGELSKAERHMEDCHLIASELDERLGGLEAERQQALKFQELESGKEIWERRLLFAEAREVERKAEGFRNDCLDHQERLQEALEDQPRIEEKIEKSRTQLHEAEQKLRELGEGEKLDKLKELEELKARVSNQRAEIHHHEGLLREGQRRARSLQGAVEKAKEEKDGHLARAKVASEGSVQAKKAEQVASEQVELVRAQLGQLEEHSQEKVVELHRLKDERREILVEVEGSRVKGESTREQKERLDKRLSATDEQLLELAGRLKGLHELVEDADATRQDLSRRAGDSQELLQALRRRRQELMDRRGDLEDEIRPLIRKIGAAEASKQLDSTGKALTMLRQAGISGIIGDVASLVDFPDDLGGAVQAAGGGRLKNIVVEDDRVASRCIEHLRSQRGPRTTFLPLNKIRGQSVRNFVRDPGLEDYLINLVQFDEDYLPAFEYVFGTTILADDLESARRYLGRYRMVTREGDSLEMSGAMSGGGNRRARAGSGGGGLTGLRGLLSAKEGEVRRLLDELRSVERRLREAEDGRERARQSLANLDRDLARDQKDREGLLDRRVELKKQREELVQELAQVTTSLEMVASGEGKLSGKLSLLQSKLDALEEELKGGEAARLGALVEELSLEVEAQRTQARELEEEARRKELEASYLTRSIEGWEKELHEVQQREAELTLKVAEARKEAARLEEGVLALSEELEGLSSELEGLRQEREKCSRRLENLFGRRAQVEARVGVLQGQIEGLEQKVAELVEVRKDFEVKLEARGGLPEGGEDAVPALTKTRRKLETVLAALKELGPVNLLAVEQYTQLEERQKELIERLETLRQESDSLRERIERFGDLKKSAFLDSFHKVDGHFREIYGDLSEGSGHLDLEYPDAPFQGGLTLRAQPRHKPMERLEALSGGEKSLAALAFIFSLQGVRPAPFYVFDEVDMFLDGRNTERLADMIKRRALGTQFLVVSLRKAMLSRSMRTIGVTPGPGGFTKVTGIEYPEREPDRVANG